MFHIQVGVKWEAVPSSSVCSAAFRPTAAGGESNLQRCVLIERRRLVSHRRAAACSWCSGCGANAAQHTHLPGPAARSHKLIKCYSFYFLSSLYIYLYFKQIFFSSDADFKPNIFMNKCFLENVWTFTQKSFCCFCPQSKPHKMWHNHCFISVIIIDRIRINNRLQLLRNKFPL